MSYREDNEIDSMIKYDHLIERHQHGSKYGLRRLYYHCKRCNIGFGGHAPYHLVHFKHCGLNYAVPRPLHGIKPACPGCRKRDQVKRLNRYKSRSDSV